MPRILPRIQRFLLPRSRPLNVYWRLTPTPSAIQSQAVLTVPNRECPQIIRLARARRVTTGISIEKRVFRRCIKWRGREGGTSAAAHARGLVDGAEGAIDRLELLLADLVVEVLGPPFGDEIAFELPAAVSPLLASRSMGEGAHYFANFIVGNRVK